MSVIEDEQCLELVGNKPATIASCNEGKICPMWFIGKWQPCNKLCGEGKQTRQVVCYQKEENGKITVLDDKDCLDEKPEEEMDCMLQPCEGVDYVVSSWSGVRFLFVVNINFFIFLTNFDVPSVIRVMLLLKHA